MKMKFLIMRQASNWRRVVLGAILVLSFSYANASDVNARIKGTVTDPSGAVVPGVTVIATNQATGVKFDTKTQADGAYLFPQLPIGTYTITVSNPGFQSFKATGIVLAIDQEYVESIKLGLGQASELVEVAADSVQVNTTDIQLDNIVNHQQLVELPLIGRAFTNLELIEPGVQAPSDRFGTLSVAGAQSQQSEYLVNGADTNDFALNTIALTPNLDAIEQFNLLQGPLNAEYDRNSGGIVSATITQGTNHIHGDVYEFYRDTFLNTLNYFQKFSPSPGAPYTGVISPFHQNIFGATLGGPILKDKLFIFGAYEGTRQSVPQTNAAPASSVLSTAQRGGNFSNDLSTDSTLNPAGYSFSSNPIPSSINIPGCSSATDTWAACLNRLGGVLPSSAINSISKGLLPDVPVANNGLYGLVFNQTSSTSNNQYLGRVDFSLNPKNQFSFVGIYQNSVISNTLPFSGATVPGFGDGSLSEIQQYTFDYVRQISNTTVNDFALHWTRFNFDTGSPQQVVQPSSAGFGILPSNPAEATIPSLSVTGAFTLGGTTNGPQPRIDQAYQIDDTVSKTFGHHQLKFGYDGRRFNVSNTFGARNSGAYSFSNSSNPFSTGDPSLDFLLGLPSTYAQSSVGIIQADAFLNYVFAQDTWRATSNLTINYGLGYSIDTPLRNHQYNGIGINCFLPGETSKVFPTAPAGIVYPGDPGCSIAGRATTRHTEFGPRIGFAWAPDLGVISGGAGKFSIRGGYGIYYNRTEEEPSLQTLNAAPFGLSTAGAGDFGGTPQLANPFADINGGVNAGGTALPKTSEPNRFPYAPPAPGAPVSFANLEPLSLSTFDNKFRAPYSQNFQLTVQREFPSKTIATISYVGALGRHNVNVYEGNPETAAGHAACLADPVCIANRASQSNLYPGHTAFGFVDPNTGSTAFTGIGTVTSGSASNYNSLQASVQKSTTHGLFLQISYTYSHSLDNSSSFENGGFGNAGERGFNQFQPSLNYGDSEFDARHRLVIAPIYTTPVVRKSDNWYSPANLALSGWQISGITTLATGFPFDISYDGFTSSNSLYCSINNTFYACPDVPLQVAPLARQNLRATRTSNGSAVAFLTSSFAPEPIGSFGNVHRNPYHGPGLNFTNLIVARNFNVSADGVRRLQLRLESDDVFNHTNFANPDGSFTDGTFGQISGVNSTVPGRQTQISGKFYF
jgi:Carboxypeptidase regulatory-like domain